MHAWLTTGDQASVRATLLVEGRIETIEVTAPDETGLYRPLIERAAELRLGLEYLSLPGDETREPAFGMKAMCYPRSSAWTGSG